MSTEKTMAIVLRVIDFSETSCVVTLFTEEYGKIAALAKGARRPKGPFESALDLLSVCRIVFIHKSSDALDLLTEAKLERRFRAAARNLSHLYAGYYIAELLSALTDQADPYPELYHAAEETLQTLDDVHEPLDQVAGVVLRFELTALRVLGHAPTLRACAGCAKAVKAEGRVAFGLLAGGVLCPICRGGQRQVVSLTESTIKLMRRYADFNSDAWRQGIDPALRGEVRGVINQYIANLIGHRPKMHSFLGILAD